MQYLTEISIYEPVWKRAQGEAMPGCREEEPPFFIEFVKRAAVVKDRLSFWMSDTV